MSTKTPTPAEAAYAAVITQANRRPLNRCTDEYRGIWERAAQAVADASKTLAAFKSKYPQT